MFQKGLLLTGHNIAVFNLRHCKECKCCKNNTVREQRFVGYILKEYAGKYGCKNLCSH